MVKLLGVEGLDEAHLISHPLKVGQKIGDLRSGLPALLEGKAPILGSSQQVGLLPDESELIEIKKLIRTKLAGTLLQFGLKIKKIEVRRSPDQMNVDHSLCFGRMMEPEFYQGLVGRSRGILIHQGGKGRAPETEAGFLKKDSTILRQKWIGIHLLVTGHNLIEIEQGIRNMKPSCQFDFVLVLRIVKKLRAL